MSELPFHAWCPQTGIGASYATRKEAEDTQKQIDSIMKPTPVAAGQKP